MNIPKTIKSWASATDARIRVTRQKQDHTLDAGYPDVVPIVHLELTLDADEKGRKPQLRAWIPLARRTPLFAFGPDAAKPEVTDVDATFPSFDTADELVAVLDTVHQDFLAHYGAQQPSVTCSLS
jgi:hypothetical protein